jgi:hypothetical protein
MYRVMKSAVVFLCLYVFSSQNVQAQFLMDMIDTTKEMGRGFLSMYKKFDHVRISGYIQPQFQVAQEKGARSFNGGDFETNVNNRFMLRRGRLRFDYARFNDDDLPQVHFAFQFDGTERGVFIRDFWGRLYENKMQLFSLTAGMFARPFGFETNLSSADRESPERGRMNQILMRTERDLGMMVSFDPRKKNHPLRYLKIEAGVFNGQGLTTTGEFDSRKDFISRISLKPRPLSKKLSLSAGLSYLNGGLLQNTKYVYRTMAATGGKQFAVDSSLSNIGQNAPRIYYGADAQLKIKSKWGYTELRAELISGTQTGLSGSSETPVTRAADAEGAFYIRRFSGAYFYFLQHIINTKHQLALKYDWYDPNTEVAGNEIGKAGANINAANIRYNTLGLGYIYYIYENAKVVFWYDHIRNESTQLPGFTGDVRDDVFTCRLQFRF